MAQDQLIQNPDGTITHVDASGDRVNYPGGSRQALVQRFPNATISPGILEDIQSLSAPRQRVSPTLEVVDGKAVLTAPNGIKTIDDATPANLERFMRVAASNNYRPEFTPEVNEILAGYTPEQQRQDQLAAEEKNIENLRALSRQSYQSPEVDYQLAAADMGIPIITSQDLASFMASAPQAVKDRVEGNYQNYLRSLELSQADVQAGVTPETFAQKKASEYLAQAPSIAASYTPPTVPKIYSEAEMRKAFEDAAKSGGYSVELSDFDSWVARAMREGLPAALAEYQKRNPGVDYNVTEGLKQIADEQAKTILRNAPLAPVSGVFSSIPTFNQANLYAPTAFQPQQSSQQPLYPAQPQAGLRSALEAPSLINMPATRPTLSPDAAYLNPLISDLAARPTLDARTAYVDAPAQMRAGGVVGYQEGGMPQYSPEEVGSTFDISEYIDPETGRFYINEFERDVVFNPELREAERVARERMTPEEEALNLLMMRGRFGLPGAPRMVRPFAEGGLASVAQQVASEGRRGDSTLVHMTNDEVAGLQSLANLMGGSLTVNPETGLPEANFFKKILPIVAAIAAPYLGPGLTGAALAGGLAATGTVIGGGSLDQGIKTGLTAFGSAGLTSGAMGADPLGATTGESTFSIANTFGAPKTGAIGSESGGVNILAGGDPAVDALQNAPIVVPQNLQPAAAAAGAGTAAGTGTAAAKTAGGTKILGMDPITLGLLGMTAYGGAEGLEESKEQQRLYEQQQAEIAAEQRRRRGAGYDAYARSGLASIPMGAGGGMVAMAGGGMTYMEAGGTTGPTGLPRDVTGTGDGMSDSVPATIEGVQEARLADGEFVIPADVVADIGNGSSDAGSKKLYDMMDRIRKARHGTTEQPPEINAEKLMPA